MTGILNTKYVKFFPFLTKCKLTECKISETGIELGSLEQPYNALPLSYADDT